MAARTALATVTDARTLGDQQRVARIWQALCFRTYADNILVTALRDGVLGMSEPIPGPLPRVVDLDAVLSAPGGPFSAARG